MDQEMDDYKGARPKATSPDRKWKTKPDTEKEFLSSLESSRTETYPELETEFYPTLQTKSYPVVENHFRMDDDRTPEWRKNYTDQIRDERHVHGIDYCDSFLNDKSSTSLKNCGHCGKKTKTQEKLSKYDHLGSVMQNVPSPDIRKGGSTSRLHSKTSETSLQDTLGSESENDRASVIAAKTQEYLTARAKWKRSGQALRRYIAAKFGFSQQKDNREMKVGSREVEMKEQGDKENIQSKKSGKESVNVTPSKKKLVHSKSWLEKLGLKKDPSPTHVCDKIKSLKSSHSFDSCSSVVRGSTSSELPSSVSSQSNITSHSEGDGVHRISMSDLVDTVHHKALETDQSEARHKNVNSPDSPSHKSCKKKEKGKEARSKVNLKDKGKKLKNKGQYTCEKNHSVLKDVWKSSDDEEFEYSFDKTYGEVIRKPVRGKAKKKARKHHIEDEENRKHSVQLSGTTSAALSDLHYAIPYLPERFRRVHRPDPIGGISDSQSHGVTGIARGSHINDQKMIKTGQLHDGKDCGVKDTDMLHERRFINIFHDGQSGWDDQNYDPSGKNYSLQREKTGKPVWDVDDCADFQLSHVNLESSLEDPLHVRKDETDEKFDICAGLLDFVRNVDEPLIPDDELKANPDSVKDEKKDRCSWQGSSWSNVRGSIRKSDSLVTRKQSDDVYPWEHTEKLARSGRSGPLGDDYVCDGLEVFAEFNTLADENDVPIFKNTFEDEDNTESTLDPVESSSATSSETSLEADDEFECDCMYCRSPLRISRPRPLGSSRSDHLEGTDNSSVALPTTSSFLQELDDVPTTQEPAVPELHRFPLSYNYILQSPSSEENSFDSSIHFSPSVYMEDYENLMMERPYMNVLEPDWLTMDDTPLTIMLEDVIQQMLSLQPDLLSELATPPATSTVIDALPTVTLTQKLIDQHVCCPICLCPCELDEVMTQLPCQHIFHPLCIQAWLIKSGTCPVCRGNVSSSS